MFKVGDRVRLTGRQWRDVGAFRDVSEVTTDEYGIYLYLFKRPEDGAVTGPWYVHLPGFEVELVLEKPKFKVGDILRLTGRSWDLCTGSEECVSTGAIVTVYGVSNEDSEGRGMYVTFEEAGPERDFWYVEYDPELVYGVEKVGVVDLRDATNHYLSDGFEISFTSDGQTVPDVPYYQFGKVQVKEITAHLMSFPAQIVQYASRSGRVDGNCKSEDVDVKIQDFKKIIDFAQWEIERLGGLK